MAIVYIKSRGGLRALRLTEWDDPPSRASGGETMATRFKSFFRVVA